MWSFVANGVLMLSTLLSITVIAAPANSRTKPLQDSNEPQSIASATQALCDKKIAFLGEATHGDGQTFEWKAMLVRHLIFDCGYNAFFIESGIYDFLEIDRKQRNGDGVSSKEIQEGIVSFWSQTKEFQPLLKLFTDLLAANKDFYLGGIDDQLSGKYAQGKMAEDLVQFLDGAERVRCLKALSEYTSLLYYKNPALFTLENKERITDCLSMVEENAVGQSLQCSLVTKSLRRLIDRDFSRLTSVESFNLRDQSMFQNFQELKRSLPEDTKVIVWGASTHFAKTHEGISDMPNGTKPFGQWIHDEYGNSAFSVGFTAYSGSYGRLHSLPETLPLPPLDSVEMKVKALTNQPAKFIGTDELDQLGPAQSRPLGYSFKTARWSSVFDAIVWLEQEHPTSPIVDVLN